jgi:hypothetical protein
MGFESFKDAKYTKLTFKPHILNNILNVYFSAFQLTASQTKEVLNLVAAYLNRRKNEIISIHQVTRHAVYVPT